MLTANQLTQFGIDCKIEMIKQNMKCIDLAKKLEINPCYLNDILRGRRTGTPQIPKIAKILGLKKYLSQ
jgi:transcriptional regulator with XRE-family HTH domain